MGLILWWLDTWLDVNESLDKEVQASCGSTSLVHTIDCIETISAPLFKLWGPHQVLTRQRSLMFDA